MTTIDSIISGLTYRDEKNGATKTWNGLNVLGSHLDISYVFLSELVALLVLSIMPEFKRSGRVE